MVQHATAVAGWITNAALTITPATIAAGGCRGEDDGGHDGGEGTDA